MNKIKFYEYTTAQGFNEDKFLENQALTGATKTSEELTKLSTKYLVIFLHGYGANGENLIGLAPEFAKTLPNAHFISPNAIEPWEGGFPNAYQWFSLYSGFARKGLEEIAEKIKHSNQVLKEFIESQLARFGLDYENLILIGFSQGGMMANYQGMIMPQDVAGVISYSGKIVEPCLAGDKIISKPQTCLIHGEQDSVLPFANFLEAKKILNSYGVAYEAHPLPNLDHAIDLRGIKIAQEFIKKIIKKS